MTAPLSMAPRPPDRRTATASSLSVPHPPCHGLTDAGGLELESFETYMGRAVEKSYGIIFRGWCWPTDHPHRLLAGDYNDLDHEASECDAEHRNRECSIQVFYGYHPLSMQPR